MAQIDVIRNQQEKRLTAAVEACDQARQDLKDAMAAVEMREAEFKAIATDVRRNLDALELVLRLGGQMHQQTPAGRELTAFVDREGQDIVLKNELNSAGPGSSLRGGVVRTSRPLFARSA